MSEENNQDALARVIDPDSWALYDDKKVAKTMKAALREKIVEDSREVAQRIIDSGLMASFEWDRSEYMKARQYIIQHTSRRGHCYSVEDILDGYFMHDPQCRFWPEGAHGGSDCIKQPVHQR